MEDRVNEIFRKGMLGRLKWPDSPWGDTKHQLRALSVPVLLSILLGVALGIWVATFMLDLILLDLANTK